MALIRWALAVTLAATAACAAADKRQAPAEGDYADRTSDGSYAFRYADKNQFHSAAANKDNVVSGRFGSRSPETGRIVQTAYSAGPRGFRARGPDIARQTDLSQVRLPYSPPVPTDSSEYDPAYDRYHDPNEDPSYKFTVRTPTQSKTETADSRGHIEGAYSYLDDVGKRHDIQYEAGAGTGFHVKSGHPDSEPHLGVFYSGPPGKPGGLPRGHSSVVLGKDGSYGFTASGPDQRRTEVSDSNGRVQGSYTYVDDKGVQRTVQYVAGADIGYRVVNNAAAGGAVAIPSLLPGGSVVPVPPSVLPPPSVFPPSVLISSSTPLSPSAFEQDLFGPAASTSSPLLPDFHRPDSPATVGGSPADFLSPGSALPLEGSAFPEDDPALPPKKWPTTYKNKEEESFFQSFDKFDKHREQQKQQNGPKKPTFAVPDSLSSYGQSAGSRPEAPSPPTPFAHHPQQSSTKRPLPDTLYGQPSRPIVVPDEKYETQDDKYAQYGGTDYQKPKDHSSEFGAGHDGTTNNFGRFPSGTIVKAHVQSLDILPFGHRVPSPSYVLEKQFGDDFQNAIKK